MCIYWTSSISFRPLEKWIMMNVGQEIEQKEIEAIVESNIPDEEIKQTETEILINNNSNSDGE